MDDKVKSCLDEALLDQFENLKNCLPNTEEEQAAVENITKLYKLGIDEMKVDCDYDEKWSRRELDAKRQEQEAKIKESELEEAKKDRLFRFWTTIGISLLELATTCRWYGKYLKFEETGSFGSRAGQKIDSMRKLFKFRR